MGGVSVFQILIIVLIICYFALIFKVAKSAEKKGRNFWGWLALGWFFTPVISWVGLKIAGENEAKK